MELPADLVAALGRVRSVGVITGAGISAESGIRTYRGAGGIYDDPDEGDRMVEALTGTTFRRDPERTWHALLALAREARGARPNAAHLALAEIERKVERFVLLTQNVDGLHQEAGSRNVIAIHGNLLDLRCPGCGRAERLTREAFAALTGPPRCPACDGIRRPDVVLFGEMLPLAATARLHAELLEDPPDLLLVAGTSALFPYIQHPVLVARRARKLTVEVNRERTDLTPAVDHFLEGTAGTLVPLLARNLGGRAR